MWTASLSPASGHPRPRAEMMGEYGSDRHYELVLGHFVAGLRG
jgi:hypothetical protein